MTTNTPEFAAKFLSVADAQRFAEALAAPGNWAKNIVQKGRTVTFDKDIPEGKDDGYYASDQLERVGYYGSTMSRKATLNGVPAPFCY